MVLYYSHQDEAYSMAVAFYGPSEEEIRSALSDLERSTSLEVVSCQGTEYDCSSYATYHEDLDKIDGEGVMLI